MLPAPSEDHGSRLSWLDTPQPDAAHEELRVAVNDALARLQEQIDRLSEVSDSVATVSDSVNTVALGVEGLAPGSPWRQPEGAHDAYPRGFTVTHGGKTWENLITANVFQPGDPTDPQSYRWWKELDAPSSDAWTVGTTYAVGDKVTYEASAYTCLQGHTAQVGWHPPAVPALWSPA